MRMGVWEIMEIDKSIADLKKKLKKSIDPRLDRSKGNPQNFLGEEVREIDYVADSDKEPCRDCSEGMQW
jgi:hypothetical protein